MHHLGRDAQPCWSCFALIATVPSSKKPAKGWRESCNPPARAGSRKPPLSTYIAMVPIAWHKPSWAMASSSSLHPAPGPYNNCQR